MSNNNSGLRFDPILGEDPVNKALTDNPHLKNSPALASDVVKSPNPVATAPVVSHAATMSGVQQAAQDYAAENANPTHWYDGLVHGATSALESLNKPLKEVQRDYKYIHSLYTRHGIFTGTLATLAVAAGATIGGLAGGGLGAVAGADLAAMGLRKITGNLEEFRNSYADSENEKYKVSMGRDVANLLGAHGQTDSGWGKFVSGSIDAGMDVYLDPLMKLGNISKSVKSGDWLAQGGKRVPWAFKSAGMQEFLGRNSLRLYSADQLESVYKAGETASSLSFSAGRQYHRALNELKDMDAGAIVAKYPELQGMASDLGKAKTVEEVHNAFKVNSFTAEELGKSAVAGTALIPSRSVARAAMSKVSDKLRQPFADTLDDTAYDYRNAANFFIPRKGVDELGAEKWIAPLAFRPLSKEAFATAVAKKTRTFSGYQPYAIDSGTLELSTKTFDPMDPGSLQGIYRVMRFSMGDKVAQNVAGAYADAINAGDLAEARRIYVDGLHEMFKAAGLPNDSHLVEDILDHMHMKTEGSVASQNYGHGWNTGDDVSLVENADSTSAAGLHTHQAGMWAYPDFREVKLAMRSMGAVGKTYGHVDEFVAKNWTDSIFKPFALLTAGFGLRIAASELIPTFIRNGTVEVVKSKVAGAAAKMNYKLAVNEDQHIMANALLALSGGGSMKDFLETQAASAGASKRAAAQKIYDDLVASGTATQKELDDAVKAIRSVKNYRVRKTVAKGLTAVASHDDVELASQIAIATQGHMASGATMAGHGADQDFIEKQRQFMDLLGQRVKRAKMENPDGKFAKYSAHNEEFDIHWTTQLQKASQNISQRTIAADVLRLRKEAFANVPEGVVEKFSGKIKDFVEPEFESKLFTPEEIDLIDRGEVPSRFQDEAFQAELRDNRKFSSDQFIKDSFEHEQMAEREADLRAYFGLTTIDMNMLRHHGVVPLKKVLDALNRNDPNYSAEFVSAMIEHGDLAAIEVGEKGNYIVPDTFTYREAGEFKGMAYKIGKSKGKFVPVDWYPSRVKADDYARGADGPFLADWEDRKADELAQQYVDELNAHYGNVAKLRDKHNAEQAKLTKSFLEATGETEEEFNDRIWAEVTRLEEARIKGVHFKTGAPLSKADDLYLDERSVLSRYKNQDASKFAFDRVDDLRNTLTGVDGTFHETFANAIANRAKINFTQTRGIDSAAKPKSIIGPDLVDYIGPNQMNRIIQGGFKKMIDPIVGNLSRQPLFFLHTKEAMAFYKPMVEAGKISEETALRLAMTRATHAMLPQIHNVALRTQFSVLARNFMPFYFAQEQAVKRYIKLGADNPQALREYQLIEHGLNDPGFIQTDDQGNKFVTLPFVGELGAGVMNAAASLGMPVVGNLPLTIKGDTQSLKTVLPEITTPGTSPFVNLAANSLVSFFPQLARPVKTVIGSRGFGATAIDTLIPSAPARAWFKALNANEQDSTFHSAMLSAMAAANYHNQLPGPNASPTERQEFIDRIKNNARSILIMKGILGTVSPLSPQLSQEDPGLRDEFYKLVQAKNDYPAALQEFLGKHGDKAISYTVARSEGTIKGANMPYTDEAMNWMQSNEALLKSDRAVGAAFLLPQNASGAGDKQAIYDEVLKMHLRSRRTPQDFMDSIYVNAGNNGYYAAKDLHDKTIAAAGDNIDWVNAENENWRSFVNDYKLANPIWADDFMSPEKRNIAVKAIDDLNHLFSTGQAPKDEQSKLVYGLMQDYKKHEEAKNIIRGYQTTTTLTEENDNWQAYLKQKSLDDPRLTTVINGVFRRLS